jgi:hypothetical protein
MVRAASRRLAPCCAALVGLALLLLGPAPGGAQDGDAAALLTATRWCHESSTGLSFHTMKLRFQPDGVLLIRKDTEMANGSHTGSNLSARWELGPGLVIIHEPNGGQSRLPMTVAGAGRGTRLTLGTMTYTVCR